MRNYRHWGVWLILIASAVFGSLEVEAASRPLTDLGYFHWANQFKTPADNTFVMHYGQETEIVPISGNVDKGTLTVDNTTNTSSALVKNVGFYHGKQVNLKATIKKNKSNLAGGSLFLYQSYFLGIDIDGEMIVNYEFLDQNNEPLTVETSFNYYGLNANKYIGFSSPGSWIKGIYANNPTNILYDIWDGGTDDYWFYLKNLTKGVPWHDPRQNLELTTKPINKIQFVVHNNDSTTSSLDYSTDFVADPEFPMAYGIDSSFAKANQKIDLKAQQTIPNIKKWEKSKSMQVKFDLSKIYDTQQYSFKGAKITNLNGDDLTDLFTVTNDQEKKIILKTKDLNDKRLYDTVLFYYLNLRWEGETHPVDIKSIQNENLPLRFSVSTQLNGQPLGEQPGETLVNYKGNLKVLFLDDKDAVLHPPLITQGIVTTSYDLSKEYPEIEGYDPVKNAEKDLGVYLPDEQTIDHRYRKGKALQFELMNKENPLYASRFTGEREISFKITHEKSEKVYLTAQCGEEEKVLKEYTDAPEEIADKFTVQFPEQWFEQEVSFYIKDSKGNISEKERRVLKKELSPTLVLPDELTFGETVIPTMDTFLSLTQKEEIRVVDDSQLDHSHWRVKVKEEQPLTDEQTHVLDRRLSFKEQDQHTPINEENQLVWEGSGSEKMDLAEHLQLMIFSSDNVGNYQGVLRWTLEDAPN